MRTAHPALTLSSSSPSASFDLGLPDDLGAAVAGLEDLVCGDVLVAAEDAREETVTLEVVDKTALYTWKSAITEVRPHAQVVDEPDRLGAEELARQPEQGRPGLRADKAVQRETGDRLRQDGRAQSAMYAVAASWLCPRIRGMSLRMNM